MGVGQAVDLHAAVERAFNAGDVDALVALYAEDGCIVQPDGSVARGHDAIRGVWSEFVAMGGTISMTTRYAVESGDTALLSNEWDFKAGDVEFSSASAEVAARSDDGTWLYLIDNPFGAATPE